MKLRSISPVFFFSFLLLLFSCNNQQADKQIPPETKDNTIPPTLLMDTLYLKQQVQQIAAAIDGETGVAVIDLKHQQLFSFNGDKHFPMQSVFKFPLAVAVMDRVDKGILALNQKISLTKKDLLPGTHSPLRDKYENKNASVTLKEIISATVSQSDNNGCDVLFRLLGGPKKVHDYIQSIGVKHMNIVATEEDMHKEWDIQYNNWSTPVAMAELLRIFYQGNILTAAAHDTLWQVMTETTTGTKRLKALLPEGTIIGHKTGTSGTKNGLTAAINDAGIIILPNGNAFAITVFVANSRATTEKMEEVIARIGKTVWDSFQLH